MLTITHPADSRLLSFAKCFCSIALLCAVAAGKASGQSATESLGPADSHGRVKGTPLLAEMKSLQSAVRPELAAVHPRVYFTASELDGLRTKLHGRDAAEWKTDLAHLRVFSGEPPAPPAEKRRAQNDVAFAIAEGAFAFQMEHDPKILAATKRYMDAAVSYDVWGYSFSKPNTDLAAGHLLYGMGVGYDLLYNDLTPAERTRYRDCIARHGQLLYDFFAPKPGRAYAYSQNHTFIPMAGLGVAAYAVYGEVPAAAQWAALARAIYARTLETYSRDGYYYEGYEYWIFSTPWLIHYLDAHKHATGEDLFDQPGLRLTHLYAAHALEPGGEFMADFGDVFAGPITRARIGDDYERSHPDGKLESNYTLLYDLAARFHSSEIEGVADYMKSLGHTAQEPWWTLAWRDDALRATPMSKIETFHRFPDHDVAFWRSDWGASATAVAFKCGPPEGHHTAALAAKYPDFHLEEGHVHPDVASFILFAHGQYLTGVSGYAGVPRTVEANTLLVDGKGQGHEGGHDAWAGQDQARLNGIRLTDVKLSASGFDVTGEAAAAYEPGVGLTRFTRRLQMTRAGELQVTDTLAAARPVRFSEVLHTDTSFHAPALEFATSVNGVALRGSGNFTVAATAKVESNIVMGPGRPGSVDKGTPEARGERLVLTTAEPVAATEFHWKLLF